MGQHVVQDYPQPLALHQVLLPGLEDRARAFPPLSSARQLAPGVLRWQSDAGFRPANPETYHDIGLGSKRLHHFQVSTRQADLPEVCAHILAACKGQDLAQPLADLGLDGNPVCTRVWRHCKTRFAVDLLNWLSSRLQLICNINAYLRVTGEGSKPCNLQYSLLLCKHGSNLDVVPLWFWGLRGTWR